jgi:hypothetical protein
MAKFAREYTPEQLSENYDKFIAGLKAVFSGERLEKLLHMYSEDELGTELALAPAAGKLHFHSTYRGGYIDHVLNVGRNALKLFKTYESGGFKLDFTTEELLFAAFHHDLGKLGDGKEPYYIDQNSGWHQDKKNEYFTHNTKIQWMDVTHRAILLLNQYGVSFNEKEMLGIMLADGLYNGATESYWKPWNSDFRLKTKLPYILHWADHMSCIQENQDWEQLQ